MLDVTTLAKNAHSGPHYDDPDVVIVGAGASGTAVAWSLARKGWKVVCLDQGNWMDPEGMAHTHVDWERTRFSSMSPNPNARRLPQDYPVNASDSDYKPMMWNGVGGGTKLWGGLFPRYHPSDFRVRTLDGVADDWPVDYEQLEPWYDLNDELIGVSGLAGDPAQPPRKPRPTPPLPLGDGGLRMLRAFDALGWHCWPSEVAMISRDYEDPRRQPCNYCSACDVGCPRGSRSDADWTYGVKAVEAGAEIRTGCRVREVCIDRRGRATGVLYYDEAGALRRIDAPLVVMAANGIGTPRLLLNSTSATFPDGLANRSGLVGKNLMFHPYSSLTGIFDEEIDDQSGPIAVSVYSHEFYETQPERGFARGFALVVLRAPGPVWNALGGFTQSRIPWGEEHHERFRRRWRHQVNLVVLGEDLPETANEVVLDPELCDAHGIPAPKINYRMNHNSRRLLDYGVQRAQELFAAAGAAEVLVRNPLHETGWHLMGTCRMGAAPLGSVVDQWGRSHDVPNLFIVDGSVFVTSAAVNPTPTIQALALRSADYIARTGR